MLEKIVKNMPCCARQFLRRLFRADCAPKVAPKAVRVARATRLSIWAERPYCPFWVAFTLFPVGKNLQRRVAPCGAARAKRGYLLCRLRLRTTNVDSAHFGLTPSVWTTSPKAGSRVSLGSLGKPPTPNRHPWEGVYFRAFAWNFGSAPPVF